LQSAHPATGTGTLPCRCRRRPGNTAKATPFCHVTRLDMASQTQPHMAAVTVTSRTCTPTRERARMAPPRACHGCARPRSAARPCFSTPLPGHRLTTVDHLVPRSSRQRHTCTAHHHRLAATVVAVPHPRDLRSTLPLHSSPELFVEQLAAAPFFFFFLQLRGKPGLSSALAHPGARGPTAAGRQRHSSAPGPCRSPLLSSVRPPTERAQPA
jgi:hypothetical protein